MGFSSSISNGRPIRHDVTVRVQELKKQQIEKDQKAAAERADRKLEGVGR
jgi:hypothetical protein